MAPRQTRELIGARSAASTKGQTLLPAREAALGDPPLGCARVEVKRVALSGPAGVATLLRVPSLHVERVGVDAFNGPDDRSKMPRQRSTPARSSIKFLNPTGEVLD
jgi:hypothetical protein